MEADNKIINEMTEQIAKIGYNSQFDNGWNNLPNNCMERIIWHRTALAIMDYLTKFGECLAREAEKNDKVIITKRG